MNKVKTNGRGGEEEETQDTKATIFIQELLEELSYENSALRGEAGALRQEMGALRARGEELEARVALLERVAVEREAEREREAVRSRAAHARLRDEAAKAQAEAAEARARREFMVGELQACKEEACGERLTHERRSTVLLDGIEGALAQ